MSTNNSLSFNASLIIGIIILLVGAQGFKDLKEEKLYSLNDVEYYGSTYKTRRGGSTHLTYHLYIHLKGNPIQLSVDGAIYQTFNHNEFKKDFNRGDIISIKYVKSRKSYNEVYSLVNKGKEYCRLDMANTNSRENALWLVIPSAYVIVISIIGLSVPEQNRDNVSALIMIGLIFIFLILYCSVGAETWTSINYRNL